MISLLPAGRSLNREERRELSWLVGVAAAPVSQLYSSPACLATEIEEGGGEEIWNYDNILKLQNYIVAGLEVCFSFCPKCNITIIVCGGMQIDSSRPTEIFTFLLPNNLALHSVRPGGMNLYEN